MALLHWLTGRRGWQDGDRPRFACIMPILHVNNAHNVVRSKMSEDFTDNAIVRNSNCLKYLDENHDSQTDDEDLNTTYDHMYASNSENDDVGPDAENCQNTESEVKFLKQWLILHLDLIQQQNDEILDKENQIHILRKENEMVMPLFRYLDHM